jgi:flagellar biosynthesis/type III secretory pathway M-ring protein FliF/YscJ
MDAQRWVMLAVVVLVVAVIAYRQVAQRRERTDQARRMSAQAQGQARLPGDWSSQREDRRLAGMSDEDQAWEQASLHRQRASQAPPPQVVVSADHEPTG